MILTIVFGRVGLPEFDRRIRGPRYKPAIECAERGQCSHMRFDFVLDPPLINILRLRRSRSTVDLPFLRPFSTITALLVRLQSLKYRSR